MEVREPLKDICVVENVIRTGSTSPEKTGTCLSKQVTAELETAQT